MFENYEQYAIWYDKVSNRTDAKEFIRDFQANDILGLRSNKTPTKLDMAKSAFLDIYEEIKDDPATAKKIFKTLYIDNAPGLKVNLGDDGESIYDYTDIFTEYMPAMIQKGTQRDSHGHLIDILMQRSTLKEQYKMWRDDRKSIADVLYKNYRVIDTKGTEALVYTTKELNDNNVEIEDVKDAIPYFMTYFDKKDGTVIEVIPNDPRDRGKNQIDTIGLMNRKIKKGDEDATMWIAFRRDKDSKGLEAVIMGGNYDTGRYEPVGRPQIVQSKFVRPRRPKEVTRQEFIVPDEVAWKIIKDAKAYFLFEAENDWYEVGGWLGQDTLKEKMEGYIKKYGKEETDPDTGKVSHKYTSERANYLFESKSIPNWLIEIGEPRQFEFEHVIAPFWKENSHLPNEEFVKAWNLKATEETYNWRERWWNDFWQDWAHAINPPEVVN